MQSLSSTGELVPYSELMSSSTRSRRTRRVNTNESDEEEYFQYEDGDLRTVETVEGLDVGVYGAQNLMNYCFIYTFRSQLEFRIRILSDLLICPICHGFFRDAMTIKECLHTCRYLIVLVAPFV